MKLHDAIVGLTFCALGLAFVLLSSGLPSPRHIQYGPGVFPTLMGVGLMVCGSLQFLVNVRNLRTEPLWDLPTWLGDRRLALNVFAIPAAALVYYFAAETLGFVVTGTLILTVLFVIGGVAPLRAFAIGVILCAATTIIFVSILHVPLSWGLLAPISGWLIW